MEWRVSAVGKPTPDDHTRHYRTRAKDCREIADSMHDPVAKSHMLAVARSYERLAAIVDRASPTRRDVTVTEEAKE
jgi:hypothetical protein